MKRALIAAGIVLSLAGRSNGQIVITEVHPTGSSASYAADGFELTNRGSSAVNITGWTMDDNSFSAASSVPMTLAGNSIAPGQSVWFLESAAGAAIPAFSTAWFGTSTPPTPVGFYSGSGVGLSSGGDGVAIFDSGGGVVTGVQFGAATLGVTFDNNANIGGTSVPFPTISQLSVVGVNGAFTSPGTSEIGSPGVAPVPEPTSIALCSIAAVGYGIRRMRRKKA